MNDALIFAHGHMFALLAEFLDRGGIVKASDLAKLTEGMSEQNPNAEQSVILAIWADCIKGVANSRKPD